MRRAYRVLRQLLRLLRWIDSNPQLGTVLVLAVVMAGASVAAAVS